MSKLYASPFRVYLLLGTLALVGIFSGFKLPVSLFPNSSKPTVWVDIPFASLNAEEFVNNYGKNLEYQLHAIKNDKVEVEKIESTYSGRHATYDIYFKWGVSPQAAMREVQNVVNAFAAWLPQESRDRTNIWLDNENSGFFALSFFSDKRGPDELYDLLEPMLGPRIAKVKDAQEPRLYNPAQKEISVDLNPETMAALQLFPRDVDQAIAGTLGGRAAGSVVIGSQQFQIQMPRQVPTLEALGDILVPTPIGRAVHLREISRIELVPKSSDSRILKTNGAASLILFATPKPGGNVKEMSEELLAAVKEMSPLFPKDIQYRVLVDPSEFIRSAVDNVFHEVAIAALLAVIVLFVFIGSFRNVITAAIEIPLSMVLAFILMRLTGINLNLISLGGLALSAGMNVDASVVVMENIFRHFEDNPGRHDFSERLRIVTQAVREVAFPVIASTIASLVVFLPLTFTSDLSYAILGDLAMAVVFSHGFSAFVALLLVPTVRLHLMKSGTDSSVPHSPFDSTLQRLEQGYARALALFISRPVWKWSAYGGLAALLTALTFGVVPRLPKEIVGIPDTDWLILSVNTSGNTLLKQMEAQAGEVEKSLLAEFGDRIQYTFSQIQQPNRANLMARLKNKRDTRQVWKAMEARFTNTPTMRYWVGPWNPSELPIPDPPDILIGVRGGTTIEKSLVAKELRDLLEEKHVLPRIQTEPQAGIEHAIVLEPRVEHWSALRESGARFTPFDLADIVRVGTQGRKAGDFPIQDRVTEILLHYPRTATSSLEDIGAFPIGVGAKIVPLRAITKVEIRDAAPPVFRVDQRELFYVKARKNMGEEATVKPAIAKAEGLVQEWKKKNPTSPVGVTFEDAAHDLNEAIHQLGTAVALSIALIFLVMLVQFGSIIEPLLVLVAIPLGFIGVLISLFIFGSTLSLNSILGVILLNGIAVANSIILVDFTKKLYASGLSPLEAGLTAAKKRLRPILITSLTTVLGMIPIAIGIGEGGRILQPLGIAVSGGLWISMLLTLFLVPALHVSYLEWHASRVLRKVGLPKKVFAWFPRLRPQRGGV